MFGPWRLEVKTSEISECFGFSLTLSFKISFRSNFSTVDMCLSRQKVRFVSLLDKLLFKFRMVQKMLAYAGVQIVPMMQSFICK